MDQTDFNGLFAEVTAEARQEEQDAIAELQAFALEVGPERLFAAAMVMLTLIPPGSASDATHGTVLVKTELLAYHLAPIFGNPPKGPLTPQGIERTLELAEILFRSYIQGNSFGEERADESNLPPDLKALIGHLVINTKIVRGSAYPEQTMQEISEIQGHFEEWFSSRGGIGPRRSIDLLLAILRTEENLGNEWRFKLMHGRLSAENAWKEAWRTKKSDLTVEQQTLRSAARSAQQAGFLGYAQTLANVPPDEVPVPRELTKLSPELTVKEWEGLIALIGCTPQSRNVMHDPVEMQHRPLFVLPGNRVLLGDISNAMDQLWCAFENIARQDTDQSFYSGTYQQHRGRWLEDRLAALVQRVFPAETIYRKLTYPDPDHRGQGATAELDVAIHWPPFLVVIEAKAAQFRFASHLGDLRHLRRDMKANVTDAFEQARRAVRYIQSVPEAVFLENNTGRTLVVRRDEIQRTYLTTISLHQLAGIATQLASIQGLGLFGDGQYPWAISVADLDLVTQFCPGPDAFLHYAERRLAIQKEAIKIQADEIDLFGAYLKTRLQASRIWERNGTKKPDRVSLFGFQEPFDEVMAYRRGDRKDAPQLRLEIPQEVEDILQELRRHASDKDARWIAFSLLSLPDRALEIVARIFRDLRSQSLNSDSFRRLTHTEGDLAISVVATRDQPADALLRNTQSRTLLEKYRRKCTTSIGFGVFVSDLSKPFHCATWAEWPWAHDPEMERLIEAEPPPTPAPGSKIPERNDPCLCGSKKKLKKCCLAKMNRFRVR